MTEKNLAEHAISVRSRRNLREGMRGEAFALRERNLQSLLADYDIAHGGLMAINTGAPAICSVDRRMVKKFQGPPQSKV